MLSLKNEYESDVSCKLYDWNITANQLCEESHFEFKKFILRARLVIAI